MADPQHLEWLKQGVAAWNERRQKAPFLPDLQEAELQGANLQGADLQGANLQEAVLREADLRQAKMPGAELQGADLWRADLQGADLWRADLQGANLQEANLQGADLWRANLQEADLWRANLQEAVLREANLQGADARSLKSALRTNNASKADFTLAQQLTQDQLETMIGDTGVLLPEGLVHPDHWPVWEEDEGALETDNEEENHTSSDVSARQDKELQDAIIATSSLSAEVGEDEKLKAIAGPPGGRPAPSSNDEVMNLFRQIEHGAVNFLVKYKDDHLQLPRSLETHFGEVQRLATQRNRDWFIWENLISAINGPLVDKYYSDDWRGSAELAQLVVTRMKSLEPHLKLVPPPNMERASKPRVEVDETVIEKAQELAASVRVLIAKNEDRFVPETIDILKNEKEALDQIVDTGSRAEGVLDEDRKSDFRKTVMRLAGFVAGSLRLLVNSAGRIAEGAAGASAANAATNPDAASTLLSSLEKIWVLLKTFFPS